MKKITIFLALNLLTGCPEKEGKEYFCRKVCQKGIDCELIAKKELNVCEAFCIKGGISSKYSTEEVKVLTGQILSLTCHQFEYLMNDSGS